MKMTSSILEKLTTDEFAVTFSFVSNPRAVCHALRRSEYVENLRLALSSGEVTEEAIRSFSATLLRELEYGKRFPHELALAAIAVTLEIRSTPFAEEFVFDLARLDLAELPIAIRVAREACQERLKYPANKSKCFSIGDDQTLLEVWQIAPESRRVSVGQSEEYCEFSGA